jgi:hypothetical protein
MEFFALLQALVFFILYNISNLDPSLTIIIIKFLNTYYVICQLNLKAFYLNKQTHWKLKIILLQLYKSYYLQNEWFLLFIYIFYPKNQVL